MGKEVFTSITFTKMQATFFYLSRNKPKKKQKVIRRDERSSAAPTGAGDADTARQFPGSSQDARYADMAPK